MAARPTADRVGKTGAAAAARAESVVLEYQEVFAFFDKGKTGRLTAEQFGEAVRALGHAPTETELTALKSAITKIYGPSEACGVQRDRVLCHSACMPAQAWRSPTSSRSCPPSWTPR